VVFKANGTKAFAENVGMLAKSTLGGFFYGNNLHIGVAVCDLVILFRVANLIATIGKHRMPFGGGFPVDTIKGLLVYFDQVNFFIVKVVSKVAVRYLCICHNVYLFACNAPLKGL
jgi:hypothetical protein